MNSINKIFSNILPPLSHYHSFFRHPHSIPNIFPLIIIFSLIASTSCPTQEFLNSFLVEMSQNAKSVLPMSLTPTRTHCAMSFEERHAMLENFPR